MVLRCGAVLRTTTAELMQELLLGDLVGLLGGGWRIMAPLRVWGGLDVAGVWTENAGEGRCAGGKQLCGTLTLIRVGRGGDADAKTKQLIVDSSQLIVLAISYIWQGTVQPLTLGPGWRRSILLSPCARGSSARRCSIPVLGGCCTSKKNPATLAFSASGEEEEEMFGMVALDGVEVGHQLASPFSLPQHRPAIARLMMTSVFSSPVRRFADNGT